MEKQLQQIIDTLRLQQHTISMAESCTGGRVAAAFTAIAGASAVFHGSCVTYANDMKHLWLGVSHETLAQYGAVSQACIEEMLTGIQHKASSDYAIAISGIAGPDGGSVDKPVGTVYIGIRSPANTVIEKCHFEGDREAVQHAAVVYAINLLEKNLIKS